MRTFKTLPTSVAIFTLAFSLSAGRAQAGPIFITGHDPDFHAQFSPGAASFLDTALNYVMAGTLNDNTDKFLWVEEDTFGAFGGHVIGANSLSVLGLTAGQDYDVVNAAGLATANLSSYKAIAVASTFGGMLTSAELNELIARSADIAAFVNAGGGLFASSECEAGIWCSDTSTLAAPHGALFGFLPVTASSVATTTPFTLTAFGSSLGFTPAAVGYINECCTHNSFGSVAGLSVVDTDGAGLPTTYAGNVGIGPGGFTTGDGVVPEPSTLTLLGLGLTGVAIRYRRRHSRSPS